MRRAASVVLLALLIVIMLTPAIYVGEVSSESAIIRVPDDYATIQDAVDAANSSDVIQVSAGIYYEHVKVRKSNLTLIGEGSSRTIVDGQDYGVVLHLHDGKYAKVAGFTFRNGDKGIQLNEAHGAVLTNNTVTNNNGGGISVIDSNNVKMRNNIIQNSHHNFGVTTSHEENISCYIHDIDISNKVNGKTIYYMLNQKDRSFDSTSFPDLGYLALVNSNNITIKNLDFQDVAHAILLANTSDSVIENVTSPRGIYLWGSKHNSIRKNNFSCGAGGITIKENSDNNIVCNNLISNTSISGIEVVYSSNNEFINNMILWNGLRGVTIYYRPYASGNLFVGNTILGGDVGILDWGDNNIFYHNNFIDARVSCTYPNIWDNGYPSGGNFWSNYNGTDLYSGPHQNETGTDGIGDTPHTMNDDNQDNYPLMQPHNGPVRNLDTGLSHPTIQEALNNADSGHRIFVPSGIYYEHVVINKSLTLLGQARSTTFLDGYGEGTVLSILTNNVSIHNFTVQNGFNGISLESVSNCTISSNTITSNKAYAIDAVGSHITITENVVTRNMKGIIGNFSNSQVYNNTFFHNNFIYDSYQGYTRYFFNNTWDNGCEGNYWSDYNGSDLDGDGIGDTPYIIDENNTDRYPLMNLYWNPADIDHDLDVDIFDVVLACNAYGSTPLDPNWNPHCDIAEPYRVIDIYDIVMICSSYGEEYLP